VPDASANPVRRYHADQQIATLLTVVSMAALGLGVDVRTVAKAGDRVTGAVVLSLIGLGGISFGLLTLLGVA